MFAGIGGFRAGLTRAGGFQCVGHCEIDKYADASYRAIHDIREEERYYHLRLFPDKQKFYIFCYRADRMREGRPTPDHHYLYSGRKKRRSGEGERE